jgi:hypothetical protein
MYFAVYVIKFPYSPEAAAADYLVYAIYDLRMRRHKRLLTFSLKVAAMVFVLILSIVKLFIDLYVEKYRIPQVIYVIFPGLEAADGTLIAIFYGIFFLFLFFNLFVLIVTIGLW